MCSAPRTRVNKRQVPAGVVPQAKSDKEGKGQRQRAVTVHPGHSLCEVDRTMGSCISTGQGLGGGESHCSGLDPRRQRPLETARPRPRGLALFLAARRRLASPRVTLRGVEGVLMVHVSLSGRGGLRTGPRFGHLTIRVLPWIGPPVTRGVLVPHPLGSSSRFERVLVRCREPVPHCRHCLAHRLSFAV